MDLKWFEDLTALARTGSLSRAAAMRHVTHPAFGRRLRALEAWAGVDLIDRSSKPVRLTAAGQRLLAQGEDSLRGLMDLREDLRSADTERHRVLSLATGRTLARTWMADWLPGIAQLAQPALVRVHTGALADTLTWLEQGQADMLVVYHHPSIAERPQGRGFVQKTLQHDRLVPVARRQLHAPARGTRVADLPMPYLAYAPSLALSGLVRDHLQQHPAPVRLNKVLECDSADALLEYAIKGLGVCWLPWSLASQACQQGRLAPCWERGQEIPFEVRLVRLRRRLSETAEAVWAGTPGI